jgi:hypothetical protein
MRLKGPGSIFTKVDAGETVNNRSQPTISHSIGDAMPTISQFFGIFIHMYIRGEHNPPHFHALYAEHEAQIDIKTLEVIEGKLPRRALVMVLE